MLEPRHKRIHRIWTSVNTVAGGVEMLCLRKSRVVVAYALQMLTISTPETSPSFTNVDMGASAAGYTVHKIFRHAGEMIMDGEGAFKGLVYQ